MSISILKRLKILDFLGFLAGISLFFMGMVRINSGINSIGISNNFLVHSMNTGVLYIYISVLVLIGITIKITYSLTKNQK